MRMLNKALNVCVLALAGIAGIVLLMLLLAVCFATFSRALFNKPFAFLIDYAAYSLLYIAFLGAPWLLSMRGHINIDMVINGLPPRIHRYWQAAVDLVLFVICAIMFWVGLQLTVSNYTTGVVIADFLSTPQWVLLASVPLGSFFLAVEALRHVLRGLFGAKPNQAEETQDAAPSQEAEGVESDAEQSDSVQQDDAEIEQKEEES